MDNLDRLDRQMILERTAIARAVRDSDRLGERAARAGLAAAKVALELEVTFRAGLRFTAEQVDALEGLLRQMRSTADRPRSGPDALSRLQDATVEAERADGTCDRCGAAEATVSGSVDLTGTEPPIHLERLCEGCRAATRATVW